jgi:hypothetical protein
MTEFTPEAFASMADAMGIKADPEHLELLRGEVQATLGRLVEIDAIDVSEVPAEEAGLRHDADPAGGAA